MDISTRRSPLPTIYLSLLTAVFVLVGFAGCSLSGHEFDPEVKPGNFQFDFESGETGWQGWEPIFMWIPLDKETGDPRDAVEFKSDHRFLPDEVGEEGQALFAHGSAPVIMFFKHRIEGLKPGTTYRVHFDVEIASNVGEGCYGIGGSPGSTTIYAIRGLSFAEAHEESCRGLLRIR